MFYGLKYKGINFVRICMGEWSGECMKKFFMNCLDVYINVVVVDVV